MGVQRIELGGTRTWTVVGEDHLPVGPIEEFLDHLRVAQQSSPYTVRSYATSLDRWWGYLTGAGLAWDEVKLLLGTQVDVDLDLGSVAADQGGGSPVAAHVWVVSSGLTWSMFMKTHGSAQVGRSPRVTGTGKKAQFECQDVSQAGWRFRARAT